MKLKTIVTIVLLLFVAVSIVYLIVEESGGKPTQDTMQTDERPAVTQEKKESVSDSKPARRKVVAYYFHGNFRCMTCRTIEAYAKEAIETGFPEALKDGRLEFRVVNIEEPANEHFVEDYQLAASSLVLVDTQNGEQKDWRNLERVWELVGNELKFKAYVEAAALTFLEEEDP